MQNSKNISKRSYENNEPRKCQNCMIIRIFLLSVLFIVLLGLIKSDKLHHLQVVTPTNAAIFITVIGILMFLVKLTKYLLEKKQN
jgi:hypothetical protein